jgi:hypothetical protein
MVSYVNPLSGERLTVRVVHRGDPEQATEPKTICVRFRTR